MSKKLINFQGGTHVRVSEIAMVQIKTDSEGKKSLVLHLKGNSVQQIFTFDKERNPNNKAVVTCYKYIIDAIENEGKEGKQ